MKPIVSFVSAGASTESQLSQPARKMTGSFPFASRGFVMTLRNRLPSGIVTES
jgi:hypothetical protein